MTSFCLNAQIDENEVASELRSLGHFTPGDVVNLAKPKNSPLHKYFEWNNKKAAHQYRLQQARMLVFSVRIESDPNIRAYESVVLEGKRQYVSIEEIKTKQLLFDQVLDSAMHEIVFWRERYQRYEKLFGRIFDEIKKAEEAYRRKKDGKKETGGRAKRRRGKDRDTTDQKADRNDNNRGSITTSSKQI